MLSDPVPEIPVARAPEQQNRSCSPGAARSGAEPSLFISFPKAAQHRPRAPELEPELEPELKLITARAGPGGFQFSVELLVPASSSFAAGAGSSKPNTDALDLPDQPGTVFPGAKSS